MELNSLWSTISGQIFILSSLISLSGDGDAGPILKERMKELRREIEEIDREIIFLLQKRMRISFEIANIKAQLEIPVRDEKREEEILRKAGNFRHIFERILEMSRNVQCLRIFQQNK